MGTLAIALALVGCGSSARFANEPRPATPVDLTVYVNNRHVSLSPSKVGAGEVIFIITNQADRAVSMTVRGISSRLATAGPIQPQATQQVTVDFREPGDYTITASATAGSEAALATAAKIQPASLHIGPARPSSSNTLLQP